VFLCHRDCQERTGATHRASGHQWSAGCQPAAKIDVADGMGSLSFLFMEVGKDGCRGKVVKDDLGFRLAL
jgi:hypothetical protein